ncbi:MAG: multiple antibiotic resistance (MarC)-related protein [Acidobacteriaceae bacterium]|nr:multiple antibiotic resistance (MarC)-related protein [Acidobacteriaceae bacterium]
MSEPWRVLLLLWKHFALTFSALLPLINPLGSALIFLGLVGSAPPQVYRALARRIAINTVLFFAVIDLVGSTILAFFGISLPIVQFSGGLVIAAMAWSLLNQKDIQPNAEKIQAAAAVAEESEISGTLEQKAFYPFTFPVTAGPGCIVVMLTLSAHVRQGRISDTVVAQTGTMLAVILLSGTVYLSYAYAPRITRSISPSTAHGILRVIAFILLCIGVQIAWNGLAPLLISVIHQA